jgi:hypothetical protein
MTPAKLLILMDKQMDKLELQEIPLASFQCLFYNANRNPGDPSKGIPPTEAKTVDDFKIYKRRRKTLAAKDDRPGGRHVQDGAKADRSKWMSWAAGKAPRQVFKKEK